VAWCVLVSSSIHATGVCSTKSTFGQSQIMRLHQSSTSGRVSIRRSASCHIGQRSLWRTVAAGIDYLGSSWRQCIADANVPRGNDRVTGTTSPPQANRCVWLGLFDFTRVHRHVQRHWPTRMRRHRSTCAEPTTDQLAATGRLGHQQTTRSNRAQIRVGLVSDALAQAVAWGFVNRRAVRRVVAAVKRH
jgi:hypothetical protein